VRRRLVAVAVAAVAGLSLGVPAVAFGVAGAHGGAGVLRLTGVLRLQKGSCAGGVPSGSYLSVTFGTRAISNPSSDCEGGAVTLLSPGTAGLSTTAFSPSLDERFDGHGNAVATSIAQPVSFGKHLLGVVSSSQDLQDAPTSAGLFSPPHIYVMGGTGSSSAVLADVRSIQVLYDGRAGTTCATGAGYGCWLVGAERATGTYDATTHHVTLSWFSGQSFVPQSAGTAVHLSGVFIGAKPKPLNEKSVVELGTSSFSAASPPPDVAAAIRQGTTRPHRGKPLAVSPTDTAPAVASPHTSPLTQIVRSPLALTAAVLLVGIDALGIAAALGRRRH
jgi:hypothetical protein